MLYCRINVNEHIDNHSKEESFVENTYFRGK